MEMPKYVVDSQPLLFPGAGNSAVLRLKSSDEKESFLVDINRKGRIKVSKCTYQERYAVIEVLLRLDVDGPPHENPDGEEVPCPHLHVYREGHGTKWAVPLPPAFTNPSDLVRTLREFLKVCNVDHTLDIQRSL
ncbi:MAG: hypothetical protein H0T47_20820 [Planctomycetaceae bacterium]|nr:hypothetical protein [Planctomycetaceae bacterium]